LDVEVDGDVEVGVAIVWSWREIDKIHQLGRIATTNGMQFSSSTTLGSVAYTWFA